MKKNYITLVLATVFATATFAQVVTLWGGKGTKDGEFDGGLNNWTTKGVESKDPSKAAAAVWEWSPTGSGVKGAYSKTQSITSPSKANGAAIFNSDFLDNGGVVGAFEKGSCPGPHIGELISPIIDLKNEPNIAVAFSQSFRNYETKTYLVYSKDGGATWADTIRIIENDYVKLNVTATATTVRVSLPGAGGTDKFRFKLVFDGRYYVWIVDDISIVRGEDYNLRVNKTFYAIPENYSTPLSQVRPIQLLNDIENLGAKSQKVTHTVSISKGATNFFKDSLVYAGINPGKTIENKLFKSFKPTEKGIHTGSYSVKGANADFDNADNSLTFAFSVSDSTFAKERQRTGEVTPFLVIPATSSDKSYVFGNIFYVEKGKGYKSGLVEIGFVNGTEVKGQSATITIREWDDENGDSTINGMDELKVVGLTDYIFSGKEVAPVANSLTAKPTKIYVLNDANNKLPLKLKDNTFYAVSFEYSGDGLAAGAKTPTIATSDEYIFEAGHFALREAGFAHPRTSTIIQLGSSFFRSAYGEDNTPMIRWNVVPIPSDVEDIKLAETAVKVGPNPSSNYINVAFNFENTMKTVEVRIVDAAGKTVSTSEYNNIQTDNVTVDLNQFSNGAYQMYIKTDSGVTTKSFVVQK